MKKRLFILIMILLFIPGCFSAPESVKQADKKALELELSFVKNNAKLIKRIADFYKAQEYKHIELAAKYAKAKGLSDLAVAQGVKEAKASVDAHYVKILEKYLEISKDLKQAIKLREEISKALVSKVDYKEMVNVILGFGEGLAAGRNP